MTKILEKFQKKKQGAASVEWVITAPFAIAVTAISFLTCFLLVGYVVYGSVSAEIAKSLNLRHAGLAQVKESQGPVIVQTENLEIKRNQICINGSSENLGKVGEQYKNAVIQKITEMVETNRGGLLFVPFTKIERINVNFYRNQFQVMNENLGEKMSGATALVSITFSFGKQSLGGGSLQFPGIDIVSSGYVSLI